MTVIACKITKDGYEIAADSCVSRGYTQEKSSSKLFETNGIVVGSSGLESEIGMFRLFCETKRPRVSDEYAVLEFMSEFQDWKHGKINAFGINNEYIIGYENNCFFVFHWDVIKIDKFKAIGIGADFALAALHLGHSAEDSARVATELSIYCEPPIRVIKKKKGA